MPTITNMENCCIRKNVSFALVLTYSYFRCNVYVMLGSITNSYQFWLFHAETETFIFPIIMDSSRLSSYQGISGELPLIKAETQLRDKT